jgi:geranylgeranyl reductase family protein
MEKYDCIVIGAGPGGAAFARGAALKGLKTIILEKEALPRYKACGGGLTPAVKNLLDFDYSPMIQRKVEGVAFLSRGEEGIVYYPDSMPVEMVSRSDFDHLLVTKAVSAGATLVERMKAVSVKESRDEVVIVTDTGDIFSAQVVVGADGARSIASRAAGFGRGYGGIAVEAELYPRDPAVLDEYGKHSIFGFGFIPGEGYGWVFPKKDHFSVGIGTSRARMPGLISIYEAFVKQFRFSERGA